MTPDFLGLVHQTDSAYLSGRGDDGGDKMTTLRTSLLRASKILSRKGLNKFLQDRMMMLAAGAKVLNVGAGGDMQAAVDAMASEIGFSVVSVDVDPSRNPDVVDDITNSSFPDAEFDAIVMMEVLEHVVDPIRAASEIRRLLKPGGALILSTPFIFPLHDRPYDFFRFTKYGLRHLFEGFDDLVVQERNSWAEAILVLLARTVVESSFPKIVSALIMFFVFLFVPVALVFGRLLPADFLATGYVVSGRRSLTRQ